MLGIENAQKHKAEFISQFTDELQVACEFLRCEILL